MKATMVLSKDFKLQKVTDPLNYIDIQDENWFFIMDTMLFRGFASFLSGKRLTQWSDDTVDNRVLATFNDDVSPQIIAPLYKKSDLSYPYNIDRGDPQNNYNVAYTDLGVFLEALNNPGFNPYNPDTFNTYIIANGLVPSVNQIEVPPFDFTLLNEYEA